MIDERRPTVVFASALAFTLTRSWSYLLSRLIGMGWRVVVAVPPGRGESQLRELGCVVEPVSFVRGFPNPWYDLPALVSLLRIVDKYDAQLLHAFQAKPIVLSSVVKRRRPDLRLIQTVTGIGRLAVPGVVHRILLRTLHAAHAAADLVVFQNTSDLEAFCDSRGHGAARTRVILGSGVELDVFGGGRRTGGYGGSLRVLMLARMIEEKGVLEFVEAARILRCRNVGVAMLLAGEPDPHYRSPLDARAMRHAEDEGLFTYLGHVSDVATLLQSVDVTVLPSYYGEGVPRILLESQAASVAVITTDVPGCRDAIDPDKTGLLIPPRDARALADAIEKLAREPSLLNELAGRAQHFVASRFDARRVVQDYLSCYEELGLPVVAS